MNFSWVGSPREIFEEARIQGLDLGELLNADDTEIDSLEIFKSTPMIRFSGGPHAESILNLLEVLSASDTEAVERALKKDPGALSKSSGSELPLIKAAWLGQLDAVRLLIRFGADVDGKGHFDMTPLHWAAALGWVDVADALLDSGANGKGLTWFMVTPGELAFLNRQRGAERLLGERVGSELPPFSMDRVLGRTLAFKGASK